ncbi:YqiA/YcfP family alpha/beta fold hydrolase [Lacimicrobium alkaliphilum]|uniref:Esterase YqiA n=1 Tax=Lacimicrobium alkaliphilum TaxID=1526571 RepID=A0ABQ1QX72_9ALTE|nr:YqiA/YcfP family alpha/beta fold hydrolase [Lacimicrobium alkaliphilum]GGD48373.1 esterase YqiA [Lacimicrobium alkaliphilum]
MQRVMIYLHGFLSSPGSVKANQMRDFITRYHPQVQLEVPQLANFPAQALEQAIALAEHYRDKELAFVGSSMGGFLASHLANRFNAKAVLINPAVHPHLLLHGMLGEHQNPYTGEDFMLTEAHVQELMQLDISHIDKPENLWVLLQRGDETLDYRLALALYKDCRITLEQGGSHAFDGFERYLADITGFVWAKSG